MMIRIMFERLANDLPFLVRLRPGISIVGQLTQSVSPGFLFIRMFIMIYLFVLDDSLTS